MGRYFIIALSLLIGVNIYSQNAHTSSPLKVGKRNIVDTSYMECIYEHSVHDPELDATRITDEILEVGRMASRYGVYGTYQRDSIVKADYPNGIDANKFLELSRKYGSSLEELIKDASTIKFYGRVSMDKYYYDEPIPHIEWTLTDDNSEEICGYKCNKATARFRGRNWTAWYCTGISLDNGPWKFNGLPGLILKIEDDTKEHIYEAIQIRKSNKPFGNFISEDRMKTDRKTFNKMQLEYKTNARAFLAGNPNMPKAADGSPIPIKRMFYNPIEKD